MKNAMMLVRCKLEKQAAKLGLVGAAAVAYVENAMAALPTEATNAFTALSVNVTDIFAAIWPIVAAVTGGFVLISLFKKGASKVA